MSRFPPMSARNAARRTPGWRRLVAPAAGIAVIGAAALGNCLLSPILEEALVAQAQQCLSQTCANSRACFMPLFN